MKLQDSRTTSTLFTISFIVAVFILFFISNLSYQQVKSLSEKEQLVMHTYKVQILLEQLFSLTKDAETGQRGFIITNDSAFLQPYNNAYHNIDSIYNEIKVLTKDSPEQQQNLINLKPIINRRFELLGSRLNEINKYTLSSDSFRAQMVKGKVVMDILRQRLNLMIDSEKNLLEQRQKARNSKLSITPFFSLLLLFFSLIIFIAAYYKISNDVNTLKNLNNELLNTQNSLEEKNTELVRSNIELASFNHVASHDLQEPLRKIQLFISRIYDEEEGELSEKNQDYLKKVQVSANRMQILIDDLLAYSRVNGTDNAFEKKDLSSIIETVLNEFEQAQTIKEKNAVIHYRNLPKIKCIPFQLKQLFTNLIGNSLKYSDPNRAPVINIRSAIVNGKDIPHTKIGDAEKKYHKITVSDNGIGFEQKYAENIFALFQRLHDKQMFPGTGVGLAICKKVVENHFGFIAATSIPDKGTTFYIFLPAFD